MEDFHETPNMYPNLSAPLNVLMSKTLLNDKQHFRLNKINEIKYYLVAELKERELMSRRLSKYVVLFDYCDKSLIVLSVTTGSISMASFATVIGAPVEDIIFCIEHAYVFALSPTSSIIIFPPYLSLKRPINFLFLHIGSGLLLSLS